MKKIDSKAVRSIAVFEGIKGIAAIIASFGLLSLVHHDVRHLAYDLIGHFHLDPESNLPKSFLGAVEWLDSGHTTTVLALAWAYSALRLAEAYGLWNDRAWAEWLATLSGMVYLPLEIEHLADHVSAMNVAVLLANLVVIIYMVFRLWQRRNVRKI